MKVKKRILSIFLCTAMVFSMAMPTYAAEIDDGTMMDLADETDEIADSDIIDDFAMEGEKPVVDEETTENPEEPLYNIYISEITNGSIFVNGSAENTKVHAGETITISANSNDGYELAYIYGIDDDDEMLEFNKDGENYTFVMPQSDITIDAIFSKVESQQTEKEATKEESKDEVWLARSISEIEAMVGVKSDTSEIMLLSNGSVSGNISGNFYGGATASLRVNGSTLAFCILPWSNVPQGGSANFADYNVSSSADADLQLMAKIMYYGYGGGGNILTGYSAFEQEAITHFALSYVWMINKGNNYGLANPWYTGGGSVNATGQSIVMSYINTVKSKPAVKGSLHLASYYTQSGDTYQDVAYGYFEPEVTEGYLTLEKSSAVPAITNGNNCYSLEGAVYGVYSNSACTDQKATLTTNANGKAGTVKLNAGTYYVKEITAPKGYLLDTTVYPVNVTTNNTASSPVRLSVKDTPGNDPIRMMLQKLDIETGEASEKLAGAEYTLKYYDVSSETDIQGKSPKSIWVMKTDDGGKIRLNDSYKVSGDELYKINGIAVLPLGYITIQETKAPDGYLLDDTVYVCSTSLNNGVILTTNLPTEENAVKELPKRGDLDFTKVSERTGRPLYGVPFEIKNNETGEAHVIVTDENGYASTASSHNSHTKNTNRGQNSHDGVWFGELSAIDDEKGALPYGTYTVTELESYSNYGMDLVSFTVSVTENAVTVNAGDITNRTIDISTSAFSTTTGIKTLPVSESEEITDIVSFTNLTVGREYRMQATVVDKETEEVVATGEKTFTPETTAGTVNVPITIDTTKVAGKTLVVFEELYQGDSKRQDHTSIADTEQTVYVPKIGTTATDEKTGDHVGVVDSKTTLIDTVEYKGLQSDKEYTVKGTLMDKETGEAILIDGKEVTAETVFTPDETEGSVDIAFIFDTSKLAGKSVVAFEDVYYDGIKLCTHADIEDEGQTVDYPKIHTNATDSKTGDDQGVAGKNETIIDTVSYSNLIIGKEYTVKGTLMNRKTGKALLVNGKEVTAEKTFTAVTKDGTIDMEFTFDSLAVEGMTTVVFDDLYHNGVLVTTHADIEDEDQDIFIPKIHTTAKDKDTDSHVGWVNKQVTIIDTVSYSNLIIGNEYTIKGTLMVKGTGEALLVNGKEVTAEKTFTAEKTDGEIELTYDLDSSDLKGETIVVFESLYYKGIEVYSHSNINDEDQSVHYPKIGTTATINGKKAATAKSTVTLTDTVSYKNLVPGETYSVKGVLMDKSTGKALLVNGKEVTAETTFTPDSADGEAFVTFTFDTSTLGGRELVVFEDLYHNDVLVTSHKDLSDEGQTVKIKNPGRITVSGGNGTKTSLKTGVNTADNTDIASYTILLIAAALALTFVIRSKRKGLKDHKR